jgi:hypothetical protein
VTPAAHYRAAEQYLARAGLEKFGSDEARYYLAAAQVHATLATVSHDVQQRAAGIGVTDS